MHLYVCIHIKYLWEDTQEIGKDGCLCVGVFESGGENQEKDLIFIAGLLWTSTRVSSGFTLPRHKQQKNGEQQINRCLTKCFLVQHNILRSSDGPFCCTYVWFWVLTFDVHFCVDILFSVLHLLLIIYSLLLKYSHCFTPAQPSLQAKCAQCTEVCFWVCQGCRWWVGSASLCLTAFSWIFLYLQPSVSLECKIRRKFLLSNYLVTYDGCALLHKNTFFCY